MGTTNGHVSRSLAIAGSLPEHEFHFLGGGRVLSRVSEEYPVTELPMLRTVIRNQKVSVTGTMGQIARRVLELSRVKRQILKIIEEWQPDLALCDREFFLPFACREVGLKCVSVNHSRVLRCTEYPVPREQRKSWGLAMANDRLFFDYCPHYLTVSFYHPPFKKLRNVRDELLPPVLRREVFELSATEGDHVLAYLFSVHAEGLLKSLKTLRREVIIYGLSDEVRREGNLHFKPFNAESILEDLASCSYAIVNAGHNLISEALFYGKPVLAFPIATLFEQYLNAYFLKELGYGDSYFGDGSMEAFLEKAEEKMEKFRQAVMSSPGHGNEKAAARINEILKEEEARLRPC